MYKKLSAIVICTLFSFCSYSQSLSVRPDEKLKNEVRNSRNEVRKIALLLSLSNQYREGAEDIHTYMDTALVLSREAEKLSQLFKDQNGLLNSWLSLAQIYTAKADIKLSDSLARKVVEKLSNQQNNLTLARAYVVLGDHIQDHEKISAPKIAYYKKASEIFHQQKSYREEVALMVKSANIYLIGGDYKMMISILQNAENRYNSMDYPEKDRDLQWLYDRLQAANLNFDNYTESLRFALLSVRIVEKHKDNSVRAFRIYANIGFLFGLLKQYDKQEYYLNKSAPIAKYYEDKFKDSTKMSTVVAQMIDLNLSKNRPAKVIKLLNLLRAKYHADNLGWNIFVHTYYLRAYVLLKDYTHAETYYQLLVKDSERLDPYHPHQTLIYNAVIKYLVSTRQFRLAYKYLQLNQTACQQTSQIDFLAKNHLVWFKVDSINHDLSSAIVHYQKYNLISDSLLNAEKSKQLSNLQLSYGTEKKDKDIQLKAQNILLLTKQSQLQEVNLQHEKSVRYVMIGGVMMMVLLLGISYNRYRLKQRTNKELELQKKQINKQNESLQLLLYEKEWLLKEIHHRVKNNLQIVISLLNSQSAYLQNEDALFAIRNSQHRMHAMSLIHQKLYQSTNLASIDLSNYIHELVGYLKESFETNHQIKYVLDLAPLKLDVAQAVPIGLILNESITNAIKYAFDKNGAGKITITLQPESDDTYLLCIADNGRGLPAGFDHQTSRSLGMSLMMGLTDQLEGTFSLEEDNGLRICIRFKQLDSLKLMKDGQ